MTQSRTNLFTSFFVSLVVRGNFQVVYLLKVPHFVFVSCGRYVVGSISARCHGQLLVLL